MFFYPDTVSPHFILLPVSSAYLSAAYLIMYVNSRVSWEQKRQRGFLKCAKRSGIISHILRRTEREMEDWTVGHWLWISSDFASTDKVISPTAISYSEDMREAGSQTSLQRLFQVEKNQQITHSCCISFTAICSCCKALHQNWVWVLPKLTFRASMSPLLTWDMMVLSAHWVCSFWSNRLSWWKMR